MTKQGPLSGQQVATKYLLGGLLGSGGMGAVYQAHDTRLQRPVAVKVMSPAGPVSPADLQQFTQLFQAEALRLASLKHSSIPHIYDHFEEAGRWFLVMEFVEGGTLKDYLERCGGRLPVNEVLKIGLQLAAVLDYLHTRQPPIIFRDLKPANVMIAPDGQVYLIDFGIARLFTPGKSQDTFVALSPGYAAPEQHGIAQTTVRSDIYSLGATLHHLLSGTHPATSPFLFAPLFIQQPAQLATLIAHMVALDPDNRPTNMMAVKDAVQRMTDENAAKSVPAQKVPADLGRESVSNPRASQPTVEVPLSRAPANLTALPTLRSSELLSSKPPMGALLHTYTNPALATADRMALSPDWRHIAYASSAGPVYVCRLKSEDNFFTYKGHSYTYVKDKDPLLRRGRKLFFHSLVSDIAWSPDGQFIASAGDDGIHVWQPINESKVLKYEVTDDAIFAVAWSPEGGQIAFGSMDTFGIWDLTKAGKLFFPPKARLFQGHTESVNNVVWSPDGQRIASASEKEGTVRVWNAVTGKLLLTYRGYINGRPPEPGTRFVWEIVSWSPDGQRIASSPGSLVQIWDATTGNWSGEYLIHLKEASGVYCVASALVWSPDGRYIAFSASQKSGTTGVHIWDSRTGKHVFTYQGHSKPILTLAWSPGGTRIISASKDGTVQVWRAL